MMYIVLVAIFLTVLLLFYYSSISLKKDKEDIEKFINLSAHKYHPELPYWEKGDKIKILNFKNSKQRLKDFFKQNDKLISNCLYNPELFVLSYFKEFKEGKYYKPTINGYKYQYGEADLIEATYIGSDGQNITIALESGKVYDAPAFSVYLNETYETERRIEIKEKEFENHHYMQTLEELKNEKIKLSI